MCQRRCCNKISERARDRPAVMKMAKISWSLDVRRMPKMGLTYVEIRCWKMAKRAKEWILKRGSRTFFSWPKVQWISFCNGVNGQTCQRTGCCKNGQNRSRIHLGLDLLWAFYEAMGLDQLWEFLWHPGLDPFGHMQVLTHVNSLVLGIFSMWVWHMGLHQFGLFSTPGSWPILDVFPTPVLCLHRLYIYIYVWAFCQHPGWSFIY